MSTIIRQVTYNSLTFDYLTLPPVINKSRRKMKEEKKTYESRRFKLNWGDEEISRCAVKYLANLYRMISTICHIKWEYNFSRRKIASRSFERRLWEMLTINQNYCTSILCFRPKNTMGTFDALLVLIGWSQVRLKVAPKTSDQYFFRCLLFLLKIF